jgi:tRNA U34 5-carboxymethylaminomethyl modifying enzyme MnmG/GidA
MSNLLSVKCNNCLIGFICSLKVQPNDKRCKQFWKLLKERDSKLLIEAQLKESNSKVIICNECDRPHIREGFIEVGFKYCPHCGRKLQKINKEKKI